MKTEMNKKTDGNIRVFGGQKLPKDFERCLKELSYAPEDFIYIIPVDLNEECEFTTGFVCLGKEKIVTAVAATTPNEIRYFKGSANMKLKMADIIRDWDTAEFDVSDIKEIKIERTVGGGIISGITEGNEKDVTIGVFSNRKMGAAIKLEKLYKELKEKGSIDEEQFKEEVSDEYCPKCGTMYPEKERKLCPKCMNQKSIFFRVLGYLKPHWKKLVVEFVCYLITAVLNLVWPYLNGTILYDKILTKNDEFVGLMGLEAGDYVMALLLVVLTMIMTKITIQAVGILQGVLTATISPVLVKDLKNDVFGAMGRLSISFYNSRQTGSLMTRVLSDADEVMGFFTDGLPYFIINVLTVTATAIIMFRLNIVLAIMALIFMPITFFISWCMLPRLWHRYGRKHRARRSLNARVNDNLTGARVVKAFGQEKNEVSRFQKANDRFRDAEMSVVNYDNKFYQLYHLAKNLASLLVWIIGSYMILIKGEFTLGLLITFTGYVNQLNGPMDFFSRFIRWFTNCMNSAERMFEIIDAIPEVSECDNPIHIEKLKGDVELKNVTFGYEEHKPVLKNVSFKINSGEMLGIVGRSGAGKTTIVNLISRLYDPNEGQVLIDGVDVKKLSFDSLRGNVAMVSQESYIFIGTVADNIRYARKDATNEEVVRAAVLASAHDFICKMPDGYDTLIGSQGRMLSGGEKQRISIARAILANPKILILDEATASVDTETETAIQQSLNMLIKGRTTISIAHRLSTLRDADRLIVIDEGKVTEEGTHDELLEKKGTYYKLRELQTKALALRD
ncbi:MAG: ATP-binding cassette domain-containing protein [Lachnospiraceae bacterium]|nr:ATP-binding cassette domain-containing protein [Lachnospiraceae bacterium]